MLPVAIVGAGPAQNQTLLSLFPLFRRVDGSDAIEIDFRHGSMKTTSAQTSDREGI